MADAGRTPDSSASTEAALVEAIAHALNLSHQLPGPIGRPVKWGPLQRIALVGEVALVMYALGCTKREACRELAQAPGWREFLSERQPDKKLRRQNLPDPATILWEQLKVGKTPDEVFEFVEREGERFMGLGFTTTWSEFVELALSQGCRK